MQALLTTVGRADATEVADVPVPAAHDSEILIRCLEVGVCGTDREIADGHFGVAPPGTDRLVIGHEFLGEVMTPGGQFSPGDLVTATVRRSCRACAACMSGSPDACMTGDYLERGITGLDGFASDVVAESPEHLVPIPRGLGRLGVLAEPASICARAIRHTDVIGRRQAWAPRRALVIGTGAIGVLSAAFLRLRGVDVWTAARRPTGSDRSTLIESIGARYVSTNESSLADLRADVGGFDLLIEATGDAQVMLDTIGLLGRNGVACLLGIDGSHRTVQLEGRVLGVDAILENRAVFGSVNAHIDDWSQGLGYLFDINRRWPQLLGQIVGARLPPERFAEAFVCSGVKATLLFAEASEGSE